MAAEEEPPELSVSNQDKFTVQESSPSTFCARQEAPTAVILNANSEECNKEDQTDSYQDGLQSVSERLNQLGRVMGENHTSAWGPAGKTGRVDDPIGFNRARLERTSDQDEATVHMFNPSTSSRQKAPSAASLDANSEDRKKEERTVSRQDALERLKELGRNMREEVRLQNENLRVTYTRKPDNVDEQIAMNQSRLDRIR